jgi:dipeptidyl aminopeptidase/acylaminoacyl peptidase
MITDGKSRYGAPVWSNRAGLIAFESSRRNGKDRDLYVMDPMKPESLRMIGEFPGGWSVAEWSPDDREIIAIQAFTNAQHALWRVNVATGEKTRLSPEEKEHSAWSAPQYTPDGRTVYALTNFDTGRRRVWKVDVTTSQWSAVTPDTEEVDGFALSPDGRTVAVMIDRGDASILELIDAATMKVRAKPALPPALLLGGMQWHPDGSEVAFALWSLRTFGDVFSVSTKTGAVSRWTASELGAFNPDDLPEPQIVRWKSFDGRTIPGVLYMPPKRFAGPRPVMINIHGGPDGPNARERPRYQGRSAYFLNEMGVAILYPNVRGSYGFGREFETLDDGAKREDAVKDIGAALDWIATEKSLDKDRVMVTGFSYGGYMTYAVAAAYSDRIRCAFAGAGISDFITYMETTEPQRLPNRRLEYGDETDPAMREVFRRISPIANASKIRKPLMILHGAKDTRVALGQADEMARAVAANGVPVWKVVFEDEGHAMFAKRENNDVTFYAWILFMERFLLNGVSGS